jgi:hypothetical protein
LPPSAHFRKFASRIRVPKSRPTNVPLRTLEVLHTFEFRHGQRLPLEDIMFILSTPLGAALEVLRLEFGLLFIPEPQTLEQIPQFCPNLRTLMYRPLKVPMQILNIVPPRLTTLELGLDAIFPQSDSPPPEILSSLDASVVELVRRFLADLRPRAPNLRALGIIGGKDELNSYIPALEDRHVRVQIEGEVQEWYTIVGKLTLFEPYSIL